MSGHRQTDTQGAARRQALGPLHHRGRPRRRARPERLNMTSADLTAVSPSLAAAPAWRSVSAWVALLAVVGIALALDLGTKTWTFATVAPTPVVLDREQLLANPLLNPIPSHLGIALLPAQ